MYSWVGWRCHNSLAAEGERDGSLGQRGEECMQLLWSTNAEEWAWASNVTAVNMLSLGGLSLRNCIRFVYHQSQGTVFQPPPPVSPPPTTTTLASGWKKWLNSKINPLTLRKLIYRGPLMKRDNSSNIFMLRGCCQLTDTHSRHYRHWMVINGKTHDKRCH